jgi:hypothetical protein
LKKTNSLDSDDNVGGASIEKKRGIQKHIISSSEEKIEEESEEEMEEEPEENYGTDIDEKAKCLLPGLGN